MYDSESLLDIHGRAHESLRRLITLCGTLTADELRRSLSGFGFPTILRQLEHTIGAEVYWQTVVTRGYSEEAALPALPDLAAGRPRVAAVGAPQLHSVDDGRAHPLAGGELGEDGNHAAAVGFEASDGHPAMKLRRGAGIQP